MDNKMIAYNCCYGGKGLSPKATQALGITHSHYNNDTTMLFMLSLSQSVYLIEVTSMFLEYGEL